VGEKGVRFSDLCKWGEKRGKGGGKKKKNQRGFTVGRVPKALVDKTTVGKPGREGSWWGTN